MSGERATDLGVTIGDLPAGPHNAITDVPGVRVGHQTLIRGEGVHAVRTGVTIIEPRPDVWRSPVHAGSHRLNGCGELTGLAWIRENGALTTPIGLTNTHSLGLVRDAIIARLGRQRQPQEFYFYLPVVGETYDGFLNDINGQHVTGADVEAAFDALSDGPVAEGNVGGGTGMICHEFKGGIGTASRQVRIGEDAYTVGVLVQANHGARRHLRIDGVPVGRRLGTETIPGLSVAAPPGTGSIIVIVATDAPLLPHQCERVAQRAALGVGRVGGQGEHTSGDLMLAFSTGVHTLAPVDLTTPEPTRHSVETVSGDVMDALFTATIDATEESIVNALLAAGTMTGRIGLTAHRLDHSLLRDALARH